MQNIEKICEKYVDSIYRYLFCLSKDEEIAKDLTQETFYIAIKDIDKFREESSVKFWLCKIAKNVWYRHLRQKYKKTFINIDEVDIMDNFNIEEEVIDKDEKNKIYKYLAELNENEKKVICLRISGELSFKDIGEILEKTETWARVTFYRGKEHLKKLMREESKNEKK